MASIVVFLMNTQYFPSRKAKLFFFQPIKLLVITSKELFVLEQKMPRTGLRGAGQFRASRIISLSFFIYRDPVDRKYLLVFLLRQLPYGYIRPTFQLRDLTSAEPTYFYPCRRRKRQFIMCSRL